MCYSTERWRIGVQTHSSNQPAGKMLLFNPLLLVQLSSEASQVVASVPPPEQRVSRVTGVSEGDPRVVVPAAVGVQSIYGGARRTKDPLCNLNDSLESFPLTLCVMSIPHSDHSAQDALSKSSVDLGEGLTAKFCLF